MSNELDGPVSAPDASHSPAETLLRWVERKELQAPAALLLELHRPLMPLAWSAAMLFGGVLAPLFGPDYYEKIEALRDPELLDRILKRLEASSRSRGADG
ncbi:MAG: hypothetical protein WBF17_07400 [Phycisphaerae bacterium]